MNSKQLLESGDVVEMKTVTGETFSTLTCETDWPGERCSKSERVAFVVPQGYRRFNATFSEKTNRGDAAHADWENGNPYDGAVSLWVRASGVGGYARAAVENVYAIKETAFTTINMMDLEYSKKVAEAKP